LFPGIKISPQTIWPKNETDIAIEKPVPPGWTAIAHDILYDLNALWDRWWPYPPGTIPRYWIHTSGIADWSFSWPYPHTDTWVPWAVTWLYGPEHWWPNVPENAFPRATANLPNISPHFFYPLWGDNGAENYWWNLMYPGWYNSWDRDNYWYDDGVLTLYGPSSRFNSDGSLDAEWTNEWASLSVTRVASPEGDETERIVTP
jgi:hypothetical protein